MSVPRADRLDQLTSDTLASVFLCHAQVSQPHMQTPLGQPEERVTDHLLAIQGHQQAVVLGVLTVGRRRQQPQVLRVPVAQSDDRVQQLRLLRRHRQHSDRHVPPPVLQPTMPQDGILPNSVGGEPLIDQNWLTGGNLSALVSFEWMGGSVGGVPGGGLTGTVGCSSVVSHGLPQSGHRRRTTRAHAAGLGACATRTPSVSHGRNPQAG